MDLMGHRIVWCGAYCTDRSTLTTNDLWAKISFLEDSGKVQFSSDCEQSGAKPEKVLAHSKSISVMLTHTEWDHLHAPAMAANLYKDTLLCQAITRNYIQLVETPEEYEAGNAPHSARSDPGTEDVASPNPKTNYWAEVCST